MFTTLRCTGVGCKLSATCERAMAPMVIDAGQRTMQPPQGECPEYWEHRQPPLPPPKRKPPAYGLAAHQMRLNRGQRD